MLQSWQIYHTLHPAGSYALPLPLCSSDVFALGIGIPPPRDKQPILRLFQGQVESIIKRQEQAGESNIPHDVVDGGLGWVEVILVARLFPNHMCARL
jgi:hypothetical protein